MARILSISYDRTLLHTRQLLLEEAGHVVVSAEGAEAALRACDERRGFDLIVLGHSIPVSEKVQMIDYCVARCTCPVLALKRPHEPEVKGATLSVDSYEPEVVMEAVEQLLG